MKFVSENPRQGKLAEVSIFYSLLHWLYSTEALSEVDEVLRSNQPEWKITGYATERTFLNAGDLVFILPERVEIIGYASAGEPSYFCKVLYDTKIGWFFEKAIDYNLLKGARNHE